MIFSKIDNHGSICKKWNSKSPAYKKTFYTCLINSSFDAQISPFN